MSRKNMSLKRLALGWLALGSLMGVGLLLLLILVLFWMRPSRLALEENPVVLVVIPLPTPTFAPPTPEIPSDTESTVLSPGTLGIGVYAQVVGTDGDGLHLRAGAGLKQEPLFLGLDGEVFLVVDGPQVVDGYTWYYLSAPYDEERKGWAVINFLEIVDNP